VNIAVGFDFDHTLGLDNKVERTVGLEMVRRLAAARGLPYDPEIATAVFDRALASYRNGDVGVETAMEGVLLQLVGPGADNLDEATRFRDDVVVRAPEFVTPLPGARELPAELDSLGVRYAILTNGWSPLQEAKARLIGFEGPVLVSERIGARKPSREAFALLAKQLELPLDALWYVGDDPVVDCAGARAAGLTAVWFDWEGRVYPPEIAAPNYVIHALDELPKLVQGHLTGAAKPPG
jgi:FMN phosphatase YigB (HAD superfamily)